MALYAAAQRAGITQKEIAQRGGLAGQNAISKLLNNDHLGPTVETFVRAVVGLGKEPSTFFREAEDRASASADATPPEDRSSADGADPPFSPQELEQLTARLRDTLQRAVGDAVEVIEVISGSRQTPRSAPRRAPRVSQARHQRARKMA